MQTQLDLMPEVAQRTLQLPRFPTTRYQGSKRKIIQLLSGIFHNLNFDTALDLYSGSGMVTLLLRYMEKATSANDYLQFNAMTARLFLNAESSDFVEKEFVENLDYLLNGAPLEEETLVANHFDGIFFLGRENLQIDRFCQAISKLNVSELQRDILRYCVGQSLLMKRPYNLFHRANLDMRTKDVKRSFGNAKTWETDIATHALKIFRELSKFPFPPRTADNSVSYNLNTQDLTGLPTKMDLIYLDPPYLNARGVGLKYTDFYHFLDGLCDYSLFETRNTSVAHMPIVSETSAWTSRKGAVDELERVVDRWSGSTLVVSYRNDGVPSEGEMLEILSAGGRCVDLHAEVSYKYALSHSATTKEQVIISTP